jgi:hypothetical protein
MFLDESGMKILECGDNFTDIALTIKKIARQTVRIDVAANEKWYYVRAAGPRKAVRGLIRSKYGDDQSGRKTQLIFTTQVL